MRTLFVAWKFVHLITQTWILWKLQVRDFTRITDDTARWQRTTKNALTILLIEHTTQPWTAAYAYTHTLHCSAHCSRVTRGLRLVTHAPQHAFTTWHFVCMGRPASAHTLKSCDTLALFLHGLFRVTLWAVNYFNLRRLSAKPLLATSNNIFSH